MLRLTLQPGTAELALLHVEGWVAGADVGLLEREGSCHLGPGRGLVLDLSHVRHIDAAGLDLLRRWVALGVQVRASSLYVGELLRSAGITGAGASPSASAAACAGHPATIPPER